MTVTAMTRPVRREGIEAVAVRLCRKADRLMAGRIGHWENAWQIAERLGFEDEVAREGWRYARARGWIETSHGDDIGMVTMLEAGRQLFAEEQPAPALSEAAARRGRPPRKRPSPSRGR